MGARKYPLRVDGLIFIALALTVGPLNATGRGWARAMKSGEAAYEQADFAQAERHFKVAVKKAAKFGLSDPRAVQTLNAVGNLYQAEGKFDAAEMVLQRARSRAEVSLGTENPELAAALNNLGSLYTIRQRFSEAGDLHHPYVAGALAHYATLLHKMNRDAEAGQFEEHAMAIALNDPGNRHGAP